MSDPVLSAVVREVRDVCRGGRPATRFADLTCEAGRVVGLVSRDDFFRGLNVVSGQSVALSVAECRGRARVTLPRTTSAPHSGGGRPSARGSS